MTVSVESTPQRIEVCRNPIVILGTYPSGTKLLARSLGFHYDLWTAEGMDLVRCVRGLGRFDRPAPARHKKHPQNYRPNPNWPSTQTGERNPIVEFLGDSVSALYTDRSRGKRWIEALPGRVDILELLTKLFRDIQFVHVVRDGRSVVEDIVNKHLESVIDGGSKQTLGRTLFGALRVWRLGADSPGQRLAQFRRACLQWQWNIDKTMDFAVKHPGQCLTVRYEALVADPKQVFGQIFEFLGVSFHGESADHFMSHLSTSAGRLHSTGSEPAHQSFDPWSGWTGEQKKIFLDRAGTSMLRHGLVTELELRQLHADALS